MVKIFISYTRKDETFARQLATALSENGADIWIDIEDIPAGMKWHRAIADGLASCDLLLWILSPDSIESENVADEVDYFVGERKLIIPVQWRQVKLDQRHYQLRNLQWVLFHQVEFATAFEKLWQAIVQKSHNDKAEPFDVEVAVENFYNAMGGADWETAYEYLQLMKGVGIPIPFINIEDFEKELGPKVATIRENRRLHAEAEKAARILLIIARHEKAIVLWKAWIKFLQDYPNFVDIDSLQSLLFPSTLRLNNQSPLVTYSLDKLQVMAKQLKSYNQKIEDLVDNMGRYIDYILKTLKEAHVESMRGLFNYKIEGILEPSKVERARLLIDSYWLEGLELITNDMFNLEKQTLSIEGDFSISIVSIDRLIALFLSEFNAIRTNIEIDMKARQDDLLLNITIFTPSHELDALSQQFTEQPFATLTFEIKECFTNFRAEFLLLTQKPFHQVVQRIECLKNGDCDE